MTRSRHTYTQRDSIRSGAALNPLEKYTSAVPEIPVDGVKLIDTATASIPEFLARQRLLIDTEAKGRTPPTSDSPPVGKMEQTIQK